MQSSFRLVISLTVIFLIFLSSVPLFAQGTITALRIPTAVADGGGTGTVGYPYAYYVSIQGWTACASSQAYVKIYSLTNNEYMWSATGVWSNTTTYASANQPVVNIDAGGNWSGWIYSKHNTTLGVSGKVRAAKVGATSTTNLTSGTYTFNVLTMTSGGNGGWIIRQTSPAVNKGILAYSGGNIVGTYRTEDNGITEGYAYGSGGFKIAAPAGTIDSLVSINDDNSRDQVFAGPWVVTAGAETDASSGGGEIGKGTAAVSPSVIPGNVSGSLTVTIFGQAPDTVKFVRVAVPGSWSWSHADSSVILTGAGSPIDSVAGDTVIVTGAVLLGGDSLQILINDITPPDSTSEFSFNVKTGAHPDSVYPITIQPHVLVYGSPRPISDIKINDVNGNPLLNNKYVTIQGVVTVANEIGGPSYVQDNTAGIGVYGSIFSSSVTIGDEVLVTGIVSPYSGLCELGYPILHQTVSHGNTVTPTLVTTAQVKNDGTGGVENFEGLLVRVNSASVTDTFNTPIPSWTVAGSGTNYRLHDASGYVDIRVDNNVNFANTPAPQGTFDVIGVVGQYKTASPYIGGYQLMPRSSSDILAMGPIFATLPVESNITSTSFQIDWSTVNNGTTRLRYGVTTSYELGVIAPNDLLTKIHTCVVSSLQPATIYHVQAFSANTDTSWAGDLVVSTASPAGTTGQIHVYFNKSVNTSLSTGEDALGNQDLVSILVQRINNAKRSIDVCLYNLSANGQGDVIANALVSAKNRGVKVRAICEYDNSSGGGSSFPILSGAGIPLITDRYDPVLLGSGLMHNKFLVIDYRGGAAESVWVWSGSWNPTNSGTLSDRQNSIEIQDVALAGAYTSEFNQMWGSSTDTPNQSATRFGARKLDNTPHNFVVGSIPISVYFSPSDKTTSHIRQTLGSAQHSVANAILTFTRKDIADTLIARKNAGAKVRIVVDNNTDQGNQYSYLQSSGIDVHLKGGSGLLHHKYALVDADQLTGPKYIITGSHNWSNSAENSNDENTLILQNDRVANLYLQEFAARYYEAGGTDSIHVVTAPLYYQTPSALSFDTVTIGQSKQDSFTVSNTGNASLVISTVTSSDTQFTVNPTNATVTASSSRIFNVTFAPVTAGLKTEFIVLAHNATGSPDTITVSGVGKNAGPSIVTLNLNVSGGWGMVSVPLSMPDYRKSMLFPDVSSPAYTYESHYAMYDTLRNGPGYWLKFLNADTFSFSGYPRARDTVNVNAGWNMIGSISSPMAIGNIQSIPPAVITSQIFGFNGAIYHSTDSIRPGIGYWVKVSQPAKLILSNAIAKKGLIKIASTSELPPPPPSENGSTFELPKEYALEANYPNPFNPTTTIKYALPADSRVILKVYNVLGQVISTLVEGVEPAGFKTAEWNAGTYASGVYVYRIEATSLSDPNQTFTQVKKMLLIR